jgi:hypothetical protein
MRAAVICFVAAFLATAAHADPFEGLYGNTVTSTSPSGKVYVYYFNKDGTFENHYPSGRVIKGTYTWKDATTACFTVTDPPPAKGEDATNCRPFLETHHLGDTWTEKDSEGLFFTNTIIAGRH